MAQANLRSVRKAFHVLGLFCFLLLVQKGNAFEFKVGGNNGWAVPPDPNSNSHNQWAEKNRFQIGDSLLFVYSGDKDSVLSVTTKDYTNCNTENSLQKFTDGHTVFKLEHSGPYYFISGVKDNCLKNEKLIVVVMANRTNHAPPSNETMTAPPPSNETSTAPPPSNETSTAPPPSNETMAAPPPSNETTASPPPSPSAEVPPSPSPATGEPSSPPSGNPAPAPSQQSSPPKKSGASSMLMSFIGSLGALAGSSFLLLF
ncbi:hypothetical protein ACH5RR_027926 [Cinchona calisaya]|uniref:Phytocyanin domain-containing protein n=1 Tax=Cinchona calisaya TaxID=153742 RepID=A0ABD2YRB0_9GENT